MGVGFAAVETDLELGEYVIAMDSQGFVGVIATNYRLLAIHSRATFFAELRYRIAEKPVDPYGIHVGARIALVELHTRAVGFSAELGRWVEIGLGPNEYPRSFEVEENMGVIITPRRALGFSARSAGFVEIDLSPQETVERASLGDASVTLVLPHKILIFRLGDKIWTSLIR
ncbi:MAG TPA: hypothetical protein VEI82_10830 [Myxococcota bacterium]|nr:hypothetical protein [Myxococcota bacterium]